MNIDLLRARDKISPSLPATWRFGTLRITAGDAAARHDSTRQPGLRPLGCNAALGYNPPLFPGIE